MSRRARTTCARFQFPHRQQHQPQRKKNMIVYMWLCNDCVNGRLERPNQSPTLVCTRFSLDARLRVGRWGPHAKWHSACRNVTLGRAVTSYSASSPNWKLSQVQIFNPPVLKSNTSTQLYTYICTAVYTNNCNYTGVSVATLKKRVNFSFWGHRNSPLRSQILCWAAWRMIQSRKSSPPVHRNAPQHIARDVRSAARRPLSEKQHPNHLGHY